MQTELLRSNHLQHERGVPLHREAAVRDSEV